MMIMHEITIVTVVCVVLTHPFNLNDLVLLVLLVLLVNFFQLQILSNFRVVEAVRTQLIDVDD